MNKFRHFVVMYYKTVGSAIQTGQRRGQYAFNLLSKLYPHIANEIRGTKYDPFYQDERLDIFFKHVEELLKE